MISYPKYLKWSSNNTVTTKQIFADSVMSNMDDYKVPFLALRTKPYAIDIDKTLSMGT